MSASAEAPRFRICHLNKWPHFSGYGFNLHSEKCREGQFIGKIDSQSPAEACGLLEGDRIFEVNGVDITEENHRQVVDRIKQDPDSVALLVLSPSEIQYCSEHGIDIHGNMGNTVILKTPLEGDGSNKVSPSGSDRGDECFASSPPDAASCRDSPVACNVPLTDCNGATESQEGPDDSSRDKKSPQPPGGVEKAVSHDGEENTVNVDRKDVDGGVEKVVSDEDEENTVNVDRDVDGGVEKVVSHDGEENTVNVDRKDVDGGVEKVVSHDGEENTVNVDRDVDGGVEKAVSHDGEENTVNREDVVSAVAPETDVILRAEGSPEEDQCNGVREKNAAECSDAAEGVTEVDIGDQSHAVLSENHILTEDSKIQESPNDMNGSCLSSVEDNGCVQVQQEDYSGECSASAAPSMEKVLETVIDETPGEVQTSHEECSASKASNTEEASTAAIVETPGKVEVSHQESSVSTASSTEEAPMAAIDETSGKVEASHRECSSSTAPNTEEAPTAVVGETSGELQECERVNDGPVTTTVDDKHKNGETTCQDQGSVKHGATSSRGMGPTPAGVVMQMEAPYPGECVPVAPAPLPDQQSLSTTSSRINGSSAKAADVAGSDPLMLRLNMSAAEMKQYLKTKKRSDPRYRNLSFKERTKIVSEM